jgi:hypothetical protein
VDNQDSEDHSSSITWEEGKQYWFDVIYEEAKTVHDASRQIRMVDFGGRVDSLVVRKDMTIKEITLLWKEFMEVPDGIRMTVKTGNNQEYFWGFETEEVTVRCTLRATNFHGDSGIFLGSDLFKAEQIGRLLDVKIPPFVQCNTTHRAGGGAILQFDGDVVPLGLKMLKEHQLAWNVEGRILEAPVITTWWLPYDLDAIMRFGHTVDTSIPEDSREAEFPPTPWPDRVIIRVKSQAPPQNPAAPLSAGGGPQASSAPGLLSGWRGPALGQAPAISADASGLVGHHSQYEGATENGGDTK